MNVVADTLSRQATVVAITPAGRVAWVALVQEPRDCAAMRQLAGSGCLQVKLVNVDGFELLCNFSSGVPRLLVPVSQQKHMFDVVHGLVHPAFALCSS